MRRDPRDARHAPCPYFGPDRCFDARKGRIAALAWAQARLPAQGIGGAHAAVPGAGAAFPARKCPGRPGGSTGSKNSSGEPKKAAKNLPRTRKSARKRHISCYFCSCWPFRRCEPDWRSLGKHWQSARTDRSGSQAPVPAAERHAGLPEGMARTETCTHAQAIRGRAWRQMGRTPVISGLHWGGQTETQRCSNPSMSRTRRNSHARGSHEQPLSRCLPPPADRCAPGVVHAAGWTVPASSTARSASKHGILEICKRPDLAAAVTLQPVEILDVDAAIIFADLLLPVEPMGLKLAVRPRRRPADRQSGAHLGRRRYALDLQHRRSRLRRRSHPAGGPRAGRPRPGDRLRGRAVHAGQLHDRGRSRRGTSCAPSR